MKNLYNVESFQKYCEQQINCAEYNLDKIKHSVGSAKYSPVPANLAEIYRAQYEIFTNLFHFADKFKNIQQLKEFCKGLKNNYQYHLETEDREKYEYHWDSILDRIAEEYQQF